jgi:hypothetical protein
MLKDPLTNTNLVLAKQFAVPVTEVRRVLRAPLVTQQKQQYQPSTTSDDSDIPMALTNLTLPRDIEELKTDSLLQKLEHQLDKLQYFGRRIIETPSNAELKTRVLQV